MSDPPPVGGASPARIHELKTWPDYYRHLVDGTKNFEYRRDDRGFAVGDVLHLREWEPAYCRYTGREMKRRVTYMLHVSREFVVMALESDAERALLSARPGPQWWEETLTRILKLAEVLPCDRVNGEFSDVSQCRACSLLAEIRKALRPPAVSAPPARQEP